MARSELGARQQRRPAMPAVSVRGPKGGAPPGATPARFSALRMERDGLRLLVFLLIIVSISHVHSFLGLGALRPALLLAVATVAYAFLNPQELNRWAVSRTWPPKVMIGLGILACISVPFGISVGGSAMFMINEFSRTLVIAFLVVLAVRHARDLYTLVWAFVLSCVWLVFLSIFIVGISKMQGVTSTAYDPNDVGLVLLMGLPLALVLVQSASSKTVRLISLFTIIGVGATIAISGSRGGFLGLLAVGLALLVLIQGVSVAKRVAVLAVAAAGLLIAAPEGYWDEMQTITDPDDYNLHYEYGRKALWQRGIGYMLSNPVTGLGVGGTPRAEGLYAEPVQRYHETGVGQIRWSVAHNSFIEAGADMGIPGFVLFGSLVVGGMVATLRLRRRLPPHWARGDPQERFLYHLALYLPISFLAFAVTGFFLSFTYRPPIYVMAGLVAGLYAAVDVKLRHDQIRGQGPMAAGVPSSPGRSPSGWRVRQPGRAGSAARVPGAIIPTQPGFGGRPVGRLR